MPGSDPKGRERTASRWRTPASVRSPWVWRAFFVLSLVALGVGIIFAGNGKTSLAILWVVIAVGWFAFAMGCGASTPSCTTGSARGRLRH